ncbi:MAG: glycosyltransferase family 25 protein [Pseudomonadota bacterium]
METINEPSALPIYVINLDRATDRWTNMQQQFEKAGLQATRFPAIDAKTELERVRARYDEAASRRYNGAPQYDTTLGCYASHYALWETIARSGQPGVVLEDDLVLQPGLAKALSISARLIGRCRYLRLSALNPKRSFQRIGSLEDGHELICYHRRPLGTQAYVMSADGAKAALDQSQRWFMPVDDYLDRFWLHGLPPLALLPFHVEHADEGQSFIQDGSDSYKRTALDRLRFKWNRSLDKVKAQLWLRRNPPGSDLLD